MKHESDPEPKVPSPSALRHEREAELGLAGAVAGAAVGLIAGPPGAAVGAVVGAIGGVVAGAAAARGAEAEASLDRELDDEIGINGEGLGAPSLDHPPARVGAYSSGSAGGAPPSTSTPAGGPLSSPED